MGIPDFQKLDKCEDTDMTTACRQGKVEQVYITNKCGYSILLDTL